MKHIYRLAFKDVKDCFLYLPPNVAKEEDFVKVTYGTSGMSYFSVVTGKVKETDDWVAYVGLNASYAKDLGIKQDELVTVTFIKSLPKLSRVICIHNNSDLDVLELSKDALEEKILRQIKVVWPGQTFPIWLGKNFHFSLRIESLSPPCCVGVLCEGTELELTPGSGLQALKPVSHLQDPDIQSSINMMSVEFRACQMPASYGEEEEYVGALLYKNDWPWCWGSSPRKVWCTITYPETSTSVDTFLKPVDGESKPKSSIFQRNNVLLTRNILEKLGLSGNGHIVKVNQTVHVPEQVSPFIPPAPSETDLPWNPVFTGALNQLVEEGVASLELAIRLTPAAEVFNPVIVPHLTHNVLVVGARGSGRTTLSREILRQLEDSPHFIHVAAISCRSLVGKRPDVCGKILKTSLDECFQCQPSVLLLDDLDCLAPYVKPAAEETPEGIHNIRIGELVSGLIWEAVSGAGRGPCGKVAVMATAISPGDLSSSLVSPRGTHAFATTLKIPELEMDVREKMLAAMLGCQDNESKEKSDDEIATGKILHDIALRTSGFVAIDLADLVERAIFDSLGRKAGGRSSLNLKNSQGKEGKGIFGDLEIGSHGVKSEDLESALHRTAPISLHGTELVDWGREGRGEKVGQLWDGVGGLEFAKKKLEEMVIWPLKFPQLFKNLPLKPRRGMLLYGPPGTGKTRLVSSLVGHCGLRLINVKGPELLSKYIGASEEGVRNIFKKAYSARPCILFFDEFESLAPKRGHDSTGVTDRVVNQLLTQLDGVEEGVGDGMVVVAATTRPDLIDPALLRPGRLDTPVLCPLPTKGDRWSILKQLGSRMSFAEGVDLAHLAEVTDGFTGADLQAILYTSQLVSLKSGTDKEGQPSGQPLMVEMSHILKALEQTKPSLSKAEAERYEKSYAMLNDSSLAATMAGMKVSLA